MKESIFREFIPTNPKGIQPVPDLLGKVFSHLTVIEYIPNMRTIYGSRVWKCRCVCGKEVLADERYLLKGIKTSCGCKRYPDLTGQKFGKLTALYRVSSSEGSTGIAKWMCRCECGREVAVMTSNLTKGNSKTCGFCSRGEDLTNRRFTKLVALRKIDLVDGAGSRYWHCKCDCGNEIDVPATSLLSGNTKSCGCYHRERLRELYTKYKTPEEIRIRGIYSGMKQRCYNPKCARYPDWGGRGIRICDEWLHDIWAFINWSLKNGYKQNLTIDRIDVNGDYCPENCRWITHAEQQFNTRRTKKVTALMMTMSTVEWERYLDLPLGTVRKYLKMNGIEKTVSFINAVDSMNKALSCVGTV